MCHHKRPSYCEIINTQQEKDLHLTVSMRSFRAEFLSQFVAHVLENRPAEARNEYTQIAERYPIAVTRDLTEARKWLRTRARGSERFGILASAGGRRLRPEGVDVRSKVDPPAWFLNDRNDVRSSFYCEEVATEFDVQGLELDWTAVCWDADFRHDGGGWGTFAFKGTTWRTIHDTNARLYLKNAYRVILTRARQGMIFFVPRGDVEDTTRPPVFYDRTHAYLLFCGLPVLDVRDCRHLDSTARTSTVAI